MPYRDATQIPCPRCKSPLSGADIARCDCGTWVSSFAATVLLRETEIARNSALQWWRKREPCPVCEEKMLLRGSEPGLFQGCDVHGYWIDADTVEHTGLARGIDHAALQRLRDDRDRVDAHREHTDRLVVERAQERESAMHREKQLAIDVASYIADPPLASTPAVAPPWRAPDPPNDLPRQSRNSRDADYLLERIMELERRNRLLEARVAALEKLLASASRSP